VMGSLLSPRIVALNQTEQASSSSMMTLPMTAALGAIQHEDRI
jgi:hypothetical protein